MTTSRIDPAPPTGAATSENGPRRPSPLAAELSDALAGLAEDLRQVDHATRLARAQGQLEALLYAAQLAGARGDQQALRGLSAEAGRIGRDLSAAGLDGDQGTAILTQIRRLGQGTDADGTAPASPAPPTDVLA